MNQPTLKKNMSKSVISVRWSHSMELAIKLMEEKKIRHLPVIGEDGGLVGILSDRDAKRVADLTYASHSQVGDFMNWPVVTKPESASLLEVVDLMIKEKISAVVVTRLGMMSGIITTEDLLKVLQRLLSEKKEGQSLLLADITSSPFFVEAIQEANAAGI